jgi:hypothetical protein
VKPLEQSVHTLTNEGQEGKTGSVCGWVPVEGRVNREGEGEQIRLIYLYES